MVSWCICVLFISLFFFFKQKTAYEMRISDWSSDVCSSDLAADQHARALFNRKGDPKRAGRNDGGQSARPSLREDDRVRAVQYDSIVQVIAHGARQHPPLDIASLADQVVRPVPVAHMLHVLFDDRPLVEIGRHIMRRRADDLHAARMGLMIGFRALETAQEAMVDVDAAARQKG